MDENDVQWIGYLMGFLSVAPMMLLMSAKTVKEYGGLLGAVWKRHMQDTGREQKLMSLAVLAGMGAGLASIPVVHWIYEVFFPGLETFFRPREPVSVVVFISFVQAGLLEEVAKIGLAFPVALLVSYRSFVVGDGPPEKQRPFHKSVPFVFAGSGLGFALLENSGYIQAFGDLSPGGIFVGRALFATSVHTMLNLYAGLIIYDSNRANVIGRSAVALGAAILLHGVYDFCALPQGTFPGLLTGLCVVVIFYLTATKLYRTLPECVHHPLRSRADIEAEARDALFGDTAAHDEDDQAILRNERLRAPDTYEPGGALPDADRVDFSPEARAAAGLPAANDYRLSEAERWHRILSTLPDVSPDFIVAFLNDSHRTTLPAWSAAPPYSVDDMEDAFASLGVPAPADVAQPLRLDSYRGELPEHMQHEREREERHYAAVLTGRGSADAVWDASAFAGLGTEALGRTGVDLQNLSAPLRVLEFFVHSCGERRVYLSQGLRDLYGRELWLSTSHPHPLARWFFVWLAAHPPEQSPWLRDFRAFYEATSLHLGDPRNWWKLYFTLPLFDKLRERLLKPPGDLKPVHEDELPFQVLFTCGPDADFLSRRGYESYFRALRHAGLPWHNDFRRPPITTA